MTSRTILLDTSVPTLLALGGDRLPVGYRARLARFRPGPGAYKLDYALAGPVPWAAEAARRAGTVHIGGALGEIAEAEAAVARGEAPARPFVLVAQPTVFDGSRAPAGCHTLWAYAHVPNGYAGDYADVIEAQIERFAPGFRGLVLARHVSAPADLERGNANLFGGDVNGGAQSLDQLLARPVAGPNPYRTPIRGLYLCSASTPPGGGVHGMCGHHAARAVLRDAGA